MRLRGVPGTTERARQLRRGMTLPEVLLWRELRKRPGGLRFRRQHPAGPYVLDFFCAPSNLAVEVDGEVHSCGDRPERDAARDAWLAERGIEVLRFPAKEVLHNLSGVVEGIAQAAIVRTPPPPPAAVPLPRFAREES